MDFTISPLFFISNSHHRYPYQDERMNFQLSRAVNFFVFKVQCMTMDKDVRVLY